MCAAGQQARKTYVLGFVQELAKIRVPGKQHRVMDRPLFSRRLGADLGLAAKRRWLLRFHWLGMEILEILAPWSESVVSMPAAIGRWSSPPRAETDPVLHWQLA